MLAKPMQMIGEPDQRQHRIAGGIATLLIHLHRTVIGLPHGQIGQIAAPPIRDIGAHHIAKMRDVICHAFSGCHDLMIGIA